MLFLSVNLCTGCNSEVSVACFEPPPNIDTLCGRAFEGCCASPDDRGLPAKGIDLIKSPAERLS